MKKILPVFFLILFGFFVAFGQSDDEAAIKKLLETETEAFSKMSLADVVKKYWVMDEKTLLNVTMPDGNHMRLLLSDMLESNTVPPAGNDKIEKSDFRFLFSGNTVLVSFSQKATNGDGDTAYSHEMRYMEKTGGEWKIHVSSVHQYIPKGQE